MNSVFNTSLKSTALATFLIWFLTIGKWNFFDAIPFIVLSIIPIWLVCYLSILTTIVPFYQFEKNRFTNQQIFNKYFPYYTIVCFGICTTFLFFTYYNITSVYFFTTVFLTASMSWIWLFKEKTNPIKMNLKLLQNETKR